MEKQQMGGEKGTLKYFKIFPEIVARDQSALNICFITVCRCLLPEIHWEKIDFVTFFNKIILRKVLVRKIWKLFSVMFITLYIFIDVISCHFLHFRVSSLFWKIRTISFFGVWSFSRQHSPSKSSRLFSKPILIYRDQVWFRACVINYML